MYSPGSEYDIEGANNERRSSSSKETLALLPNLIDTPMPEKEQHPPHSTHPRKPQTLFSLHHPHQDTHSQPPPSLPFHPTPHTSRTALPTASELLPPQPSIDPEDSRNRIAYPRNSTPGRCRCARRRGGVGMGEGTNGRNVDRGGCSVLGRGRAFAWCGCLDC